ncbi:MAG TPA: histidine kinase [Rudaea sp.]|nr:histidine kinase [Rudaea sp.]
MARGWLWLQLAVAWLPIWVLFTALVMFVHGLPLGAAAFSSARMTAPGALLGIAVYKFASRTPWPHPLRLAFIGVHALAAAAYAVSWYGLIVLVDSALAHRLVLVTGPGVGAFLVTGAWLYIVVAGAAYANLAAQRTAQMEAHAARMQLDALRAQLHPHFLFNALHTVVQLIPADPRSAARAAEQLAGALRIALEERRDLVTLAEEWAFVERYLALEALRFGDRLRIDVKIEMQARNALVPSFALQTLVENAVRHGAAPRVEQTQIAIAAALVADTLILDVADDGAGADLAIPHTGTGLNRLRERMRWLYGERARLEVSSAPAAGFRARLTLPRSAERADE